MPRARLKSEVSGSTTRNAFAPQAPESFTYDSDDRSKGVWFKHLWLPRARLKSEVSGSATRNAFVPQPPESFTYDSDGNLTSDERWDYTWDAEGQLVAMQTAAAAVAAGAPNQRLEFT